MRIVSEHDCATKFKQKKLQLPHDSSQVPVYYSQNKDWIQSFELKLHKITLWTTVQISTTQSLATSDRISALYEKRRIQDAVLCMNVQYTKISTKRCSTKLPRNLRFPQRVIWLRTSMTSPLFKDFKLVKAASKAGKASSKSLCASAAIAPAFSAWADASASCLVTTFSVSFATT